MANQQKTPRLFLAFSDKSDDSELESLDIERQTIKNIFKTAQEYGQILIDNESKIQGSHIFDLFSKGGVEILHYAGHANANGLSLLDNLFKGETLAQLSEIVLRENPDAFRLVFLNGCATEDIAQELIQAGAKCVIATPRPVDDTAASDFAHYFYQHLANGNNITASFDFAQTQLKTNHPEAKTRMSSHIKGVAISEWKIFYKGDDEKWGNWKLPPKLIYKKHLLDIPFIPEVFIGREENLEELHDKLFNPNEDNMLLLVNGQGGIGKTTLASKYYQDYQNKYTYLAWALAEPSIAEAVLRLAAPLEVDFPNEMVETKERLNLLITKMANLDKPCLLVLDNANDIEDLEKYYLLLRKCTNFHLLLTSRINEYAQANTYKVNSLSKKNALKLFRRYFPQHKEEENILFENIYDAIDGNTLVIEIFAKNLQTWIQTRKTAYTLKNLYQDINNKGLLQVQSKTEVLVAWQTKGTALNKDKPERLLEAMHDLGELTEEEKYLLSNFAVLPPENIPFEILEELINPASLELETTLDKLKQKGWLDHNQETDSYKISPVVQEITKHKNQDRLFADCEKMIRFLVDELHPVENTNYHKENYRYTNLHAHYTESILHCLNYNQYNLAILCERMGIYNKFIGNLIVALEYFEKCKNLSEKLLKLEPENLKYKHELAVSFQFLGHIQIELGNLPQALIFFQNQNRLVEELHEVCPSDANYRYSLAISYQSLGDIKRSFGDLSDALIFFEKMNQCFQELCEIYKDDRKFQLGLATSYSYLGDIHFKLGKLLDALNSFETGMKLSQTLYKYDSNNTEFKKSLGIFHQFLGRTYLQLNRLQDALKSFEEYNRLTKELFESHPHNISFKQNLAVSYQFLGDLYRRLEYFNQALKYFEEYNRLEKELFESSPNSTDVKDSLAVSYQFLGDTHLILGNMTKAFEFFEFYNQLTKELLDSSPDNVKFKGGFTISHQFLGKVYFQQGNWNKAFEFFEEYNRLEKELYEAYPEKIEYKNLLATSYLLLGQTQEKLDNIPTAKNYYLQGKRLYQELVKDFPQNSFQKNLQWVKSCLRALE